MSLGGSKCRCTVPRCLGCLSISSCAFGLLLFGSILTLYLVFPTIRDQEVVKVREMFFSHNCLTVYRVSRADPGEAVVGLAGSHLLYEVVCYSVSELHTARHKSIPPYLVG